jgi:hypothetical protein
LLKRIIVLAPSLTGKIIEIVEYNKNFMVVIKTSAW